MSTITVMTRQAVTVPQATAVVLNLAVTDPLAAYDLAEQITARADRALAHARVDEHGCPRGHRDDRPARDDSETLRPVERSS